MDIQTAEQKPTSPQRDTALLIVAAAALIGSMFAFYFFEGQFNALVRVLMLLVGGGVTLALLYQTRLGKTLWAYVLGSRVEIRKVVWPTRQESIQATLMVLVVVVVTALFFWGLDTVLLWAVEKLTGRGG